MTAVTLTVLSALALAAWLYLLLFRGAFWTAEPHFEPEPDPPAPARGWPAVVAVVPARNEAGVIGEAVRSLRSQSYPGSFSVVVVDDGSGDGTDREARRAGEGEGHTMKVLRGAPLREGWTGKVWAMAQGAEWARGMSPPPQYLWFTDADIQHDRNVLRSLVSKAEAGRLDLVSTLVQLRCESLWERLLVPPFVFFFMKLYPFRRVNRPGSPVAAAAGGSMLTRARALELAGGLEEIRDRLIDDCALAKLLKASAGGSVGPRSSARGEGGGASPDEEGPIWLGLTRASRSLRGYSLRSGWNMVTRSAFTQLRHSTGLLVVTVAGMGILYLAPPVSAMWGGVVLASGGGVAGALGLGVAGWSVMALTYGPTLRFFGVGAAWATTLPVSGFLYTLMTVHSAFRHWLGRGGRWKGRTRAGPGEG